MEPDLEYDIRKLAYHIWQIAGREFGQAALDFWAMAEQMVIELTADSIRRANAATTAVESAAAWPAALGALYRYRVRELARGMWAASAEQRDGSLDYWLAAEQHLRRLAESAARTASGAGLGPEEILAKTFETFSPANYLEQIRTLAYRLWETAENQQRSALEFWLAAEHQFMESLAAGGTAPASPNADSKAGTSTPGSNG